MPSETFVLKKLRDLQELSEKNKDLLAIENVKTKTKAFNNSRIQTGITTAFS